VQPYLGQALWLAACVVAWFVVGRQNEGKDTRLSYLAVFALLTAVLNPLPLDAVLDEFGLARFDPGEVATRSFLAILLAFVAGLVALLRIDRSRQPPRRPLCGARASIGAMAVAILSLVLWIGYVVAYFLQSVGQARPH
jgi:hypothetical protein